MIFAALAPYRVWIMLACVAALYGSGVYSGHRWATTKAEAASARASAAALTHLHAELARADQLAARLAAAESKIVIKTVEVIRYVPKFTVGRLCLDADAVGLLQPGVAWWPAQPAIEPVAARAAASASDTDVAYWIAGANQRYDTCAARLNALVDWHDAPEFQTDLKGATP